MYATFYNEITGRFEMLDDKDLSDMRAKRVKDLMRKEREEETLPAIGLEKYLPL